MDALDIIFLIKGNPQTMGYYTSEDAGDEGTVSSNGDPQSVDNLLAQEFLCRMERYFIKYVLM